MGPAAARTLTYFAYGSNMFTARLQHRVPSAAPIGNGALLGHTLRWHKRSKDGSGKCDAFPTGNNGDVVWGVLYHIDENEKNRLDKAEGLGRGYDECTLEIRSNDGNRWAYAYLATDLDASLRPYDWYKEYAVAGARLHGLPVDYVHGLLNVVAVPDPDRRRADQEWGFIHDAMGRNPTGYADPNRG